MHFELRKATFRSDRYACAILVLLDETALRIECAWVIPMSELLACAAARATKFVIRASKASATADRFRKYQC